MQPPIDTAFLFPVLDQHLLALLRSLTPEEWQAPTIAKQWTVKDVAAHLLHGNIRGLSLIRDQYRGKPAAIDSYDDLVNFLNKENNQWVDAWRVASTSVLIDLLEHTGPSYSRLMASQDPFGTAPYAVAWAGEERSLNWFNTAREYTEKWHHQQQIRDAVNKPGIMTKELYEPVLATFMMALPYTYRNERAADGTVLHVTITGEGGGDWYLVMNKKWELSREVNAPAIAHTTIDGAVAWKLFSKSWRREDVMHHVRMDGDQQLGGVILNMISVMA